MGVPGNANALLLRSAAAAGGYQVSRSLRFNSSDSAFLSRAVPTAGNRKTWTWAAWVKRSGFAAFNSLFGSYDGSTGSTYFSLIFTTSDTLRVEDISTVYRETTQVFRDPSAWYHVVLAVDTTAGTASNRVRLYVNGVEVTAFNTSNNPTPSADLGVNGTYAHGIGRPGAQAAYYFNGYLADIHFIDGQALTPSSFTEVSATTGQLIPKAYTGSFGTNGFWLKFSDNSNNTAATLGKDYSGNNNNWTPNNLSVTAGAGNDSLVDTPTSYGTDTGAGGEVRGNFATFNPLDQPSSITLSNGNLDFSNGSGQWKTVVSTIAVSSGKWYAEFVPVSGSQMIGVVKDDWNANRADSRFWASSTGYAYHSDNGQKYNNDSGSAYGATYTSGDVIGVALDMDAGTLTFYKNNTSQGTAFTGITGTYKFAVAGTGLSANWGQRQWVYAAPAGFKALCDTNLPAPVVAKSSTVMDVKLYTGNGSSQAITGLGFNPDFLWIKQRSGAQGHALMDAVRGADKRLFSEGTSAEDSVATLTSFDTSGFTVSIAGGASTRTNESSQTYVAWAWDAGSSTVTNTQGSITSSVRANASAGFSIVSYTSVGTSTSLDTIGHGLNISPSIAFIKNRDLSDSWWVYSSLFSDPTKDYLVLNSTSAKGTFGSTTYSASSTTIGIRQGLVASSAGQKIIVYAFAPVAGYSSVSSYVGSGSADGPFVYTGFRPKFIMVKRSDASGEPWVIHDSVRDFYNGYSVELYPNNSNAEGGPYSPPIFDFLSNGFKIRSGTATAVNASGGTFIYMALAESPFQYARAR